MKTRQNWLISQEKLVTLNIGI